MPFKDSKTNIFTLKSNKILTAVLLLLLISAPVFGANENDLRNSINDLRGKISSGQNHLNHLHNTTQTLEEKLSALQAEINALEGEIQATTNNIASKEQEIKETEAELNRQKEIMASSIKLLYKRGRVSTVELLADSENFGDYVDQEEYVQRIKVRVHESSKEVAALKVQLEEEKTQLEELLATQTGQKILLDAKREEQQYLVNQARSAEFSYKAYVNDLQKQEETARRELTEFLRRGQFVSQGTVKRGDIMGYTGNTGRNSHGPHLHLEIYHISSGQYLDPLMPGTDNKLNYGFSWPYDKDWSITGRFGDCRDGCQRSHLGLDIGASEGVPIKAIGDGDIIWRKWYGGCGNTVAIRHYNGYVSHYCHMLSS